MGAQFRTCFRKIGGLRALTDVPLIAVTATAPIVVQSEICDSLGLKEPAVILQTLDRPNIFLSCSKSKGLNVNECMQDHLFNLGCILNTLSISRGI